MPYKTSVLGGITAPFGNWEGNPADPHRLSAVHFTEVPNCNPSSRAAIEAAFDYIHNPNVNIIKDLTDIGGECVTLANCIAQKKIDTVMMDCKPCDSGIYLDANAYTLGNVITFCYRSLPPNRTQPEIDATLFHELVHSCGGTELDAYALRYYIFNGHGAMAPPSAVLQLMCDGSTLWNGLRIGRFIAWDPHGSLWELYPLIGHPPTGVGTAFVRGYITWTYPSCPR